MNTTLNAAGTPASAMQLTELPTQPYLVYPDFLRQCTLQLKYAWKNQRVSLFIVGFGMLAIAALICLVPAWKPILLADSPPSNLTDWLSRMQDLAGFLTLAVAVIVWHGETREDWENALPNRMSVFFFGPAFEGKEPLPVIVCRNVWLAGEGDLRQWAMQVATQSVNTAYPSKNPVRFLDFEPAVCAGQGVTLVDEMGRAHKHYSVRFNLTILPEILATAWSKAPESLCLYRNLIASNADLLLIRAIELKDLAKQPDWPVAEA